MLLLLWIIFIYILLFLMRFRIIDFVLVEYVVVFLVNIKISFFLLCIIWYWILFLVWLRMDVLNRYKLGMGVLKILVKELNLLLIFVIILGNWNVWFIFIFIWWFVVIVVNLILVMWEGMFVDLFVLISSCFWIFIKNK